MIQPSESITCNSICLILIPLPQVRVVDVSLLLANTIFAPQDSNCILRKLEFKPIKKRVFVSSETFYSELHIIFKFDLYQIVNNTPLFFSIPSNKHHISGGNQIVGLQLGVHLLKTQSTVVEMF